MCFTDGLLWVLPTSRHFDNSHDMYIVGMSAARRGGGLAARRFGGLAKIANIENLEQTASNPKRTRRQ